MESDTLPAAIAEVAAAGSGSPGSDLDASYAVPETEQAELIACWAESVFLKFRRAKNVCPLAIREVCLSLAVC